jgi:hypothetical protein
MAASRPPKRIPRPLDETVIKALEGDGMPSDSTLLEKITLDNGLQLQLYDASRQIAADRWFLCLSARIDIPVDALHLEYLREGSVSLAELRSIVGDTVVYEKKLERNFVSEIDRPSILSEFRRAILETSFPYLSRADFPGRFILKTYRDECQRRKHYPDPDSSE